MIPEIWWWVMFGLFMLAGTVVEVINNMLVAKRAHLERMAKIKANERVLEIEDRT